MGRGMITDEIKAKAKKLGVSDDLSQTELRLMPYLVSRLMDGYNLDPNHISPEDRTALAVWREKGFIEGGADGFRVTPEFFEQITELVWMGYIAI